jgi:hypothetical protein
VSELALAYQCGSRIPKGARTRCCIDNRLRIGNSFAVNIAILPDARVVRKGELSNVNTWGDWAFVIVTKQSARIKKTWCILNGYSFECSGAELTCTYIVFCHTLFLCLLIIVYPGNNTINDDSPI